MARITKRGRNPGVVDNWLDNLGLYRKNVAYDETCMFRAVSEQLFDCQVYHERVRKECISYARKNFKEFSQLVNSFKDWQEHLNLLENHMVICGNIEMHIISKKYRHNVIIYDAIHQKVCEMINDNYPSSLRLCLMDEDHYDVVYKREHILTAGFCQSLVYKVLYEKVFHIQNVDEIVRGMLYEKNSIITQTEFEMEKKKSVEVNNNDSELVPVKEEKEDSELTPTNNNIAPFPFKVAKALDPLIYRNIEYDSWGEVRREMRLGDWYYGDNNLILGTRCILNDGYTNETHDCYIQDIIKDQNKCVVYLTKLAEKRTVNYSDLSPENDAKPWPLPYRFSKNLAIVGSPQASFAEKITKTTKKRNKDKRRTKSCSENGTAVPPDAVENVSAYVGVPLQMHNLNDVSYRDQEISVESQTESLPTEQITQEVQSPYHWDQPQWHHMLPTPEPIVLAQTPTVPQNMFNFNMKPMVASAPVTPDVVPYHDSNFPFYYNYQVDPGYHTYSQQWQPPPMELQPPPLPKTEMEKPCEGPNRYHHTENETTFDNYENENVYEHPTIVASSPRRPTLCTTLTPQSTPVEMYSPMVMTPPVLYARPMSDVIEMVMSPPVINSPQVEMHYVPPGPYIYPPTPPSAWYPAGINSQGFIFPPRPQ